MTPDARRVAYVPSRVVRAEINTSRSLERVTPFADLTFRALLLIVDDFGRYDGRPHVLRGAAFPTRPEFTDAMLGGWLDELEREGCVRRYAVGGKAFIELPNWERHRGKGRRADSSKYPDPPAHPRNSEESADLSGIPGDPRSERIARDEGRVARGAEEIAGAEPPAPNAQVIDLPRKSRECGKTDAPSDERATELFELLSLWALDHPDDCSGCATQAEIDADQPKLRRILSECIDWHLSNGVRRKDWLATARNWVRRESDIGRSKATARASGEALAHRARLREIEGVAR
jgi:hypothetical protein